MDIDIQAVYVRWPSDSLCPSADAQVSFADAHVYFICRNPDDNRLLYINAFENKEYIHRKSTIW